MWSALPVVLVILNVSTMVDVAHLSFWSIGKREECGVLGSIHTWCLGASARALAQNAVFRHAVPNLKLCSHSINRAHAHYCEIVSKALGNQRKTCSHKGPVLSLVPEHEVSILYSSTGTEPKFWRWVLRKTCVDIRAQLRIAPGHQVWTLPKNRMQITGNPQESDNVFWNK